MIKWNIRQIEDFANLKSKMLFWAIKIGSCYKLRKSK